jgi:hypothetical protein
MGDLTAIGSDVRMLELSLQPTKYARGNGQTLYTWDYKRLLFGQGCPSLFILHFTLYRWTESVTCTGSSLFAMGYGYSEGKRAVTAPQPSIRRQTTLGGGS